MMPDGAEPCKGYTELYERIKETATFLDQLAARLDKLYPGAITHPLIDEAAADCRERAKRLRR